MKLMAYTLIDLRQLFAVPETRNQLGCKPDDRLRSGGFGRISNRRVASGRKVTAS